MGLVKSLAEHVRHKGPKKSYLRHQGPYNFLIRIALAYPMGCRPRPRDLLSQKISTESPKCAPGAPRVRVPRKEAHTIVRIGKKLNIWSAVGRWFGSFWSIIFSRNCSSGDHIGRSSFGSICFILLQGGGRMVRAAAVTFVPAHTHTDNRRMYVRVAVRPAPKTDPT